jgi:hypothetical protein
VLAKIEHAIGRIRILGATPHPEHRIVVEAAKNLVMDLEDAGCRARYMIRDRDGKFPPACSTPSSPTQVSRSVLSGIPMPRMNSIMQTVGSVLRLRSVQ